MIYAFGRYELDTRIYELRDRGSARPVEPQVFDVLAYLVANRDRVVTKDELLEKLWPDRFVSETTLTSRLKEARKAVGDDGRSQLVIRTHHGRGYRFVAPVEERDGAALSPPAGDFVVRATPHPPPAEEGSRFVGREAEMARLDAALAAARSGRRRIVFVTGEAGAGKTTLVESYLSRQPGLTVARGQCVEHRGSGEPYMPLLDAIGRLCRGSDGTSVAELLGSVAPTWLAQMPWLLAGEEAARVDARGGAPGVRMLRELAVAVERLSESAPLAIVLEDLHWSDYATLEAVDMLARHVDPARLIVIGTFRPSDVKAARHPVYAVAQELRARGLCEVLPLPLLGPRELDDYLQRRFPGADFTAELAAILHQRTSGNALFAGNLVDSWVGRGFIHRNDGVWTLDATTQVLETDVPDSLQDLLEKQIGELDPELQRTLETASVIGREFPLAVVAATLPADDEELERRCESLAREGRFLRTAGSEHWGDGTFTSRFAFIHDLYVDVLYGRIAPARRARLHQQAGAALERAFQGRERERAAELALHFQRAHDRDRAAKYLEMAADQAAGRSAYREVVLHLTSMLDLLRGTQHSAARDRLELQVRSRLAPALIATRGWADPAAERNYHRAAELAVADKTARSAILYGMATMYEYRGEYRKAERIAKERLALDGDAPAANAIESHELLACSMLHQGRYREAVVHAEDALAASRRPAALNPAQVALLVQAHGWISGALVFVGRSDDAVEHGRTAIELAESKGDELAKASARIQAAFIRFYRREPAECRRLAEEGSAIARERRFPFHVACARILVGWALSREGAHEEALREIRGGLRTSRSIGARMDIPLFLVILTECLERDGQREAALQTIDEAFATVDRNRSFFYLPELYRISGHLLLDRDRDTALGALRRALAIAEEQQSPLFALRTALSLVQVERTTRSLARLRSIVDSFEQGRDTQDLRDAVAALG